MQVKFARSLFTGAIAAFGFAVATPATAEAQMGFVVQANYGDDVDFGVGAGVGFGLGSLTTNHGIRAEATFDYYFPGGDSDFGDLKYWEINGNALMDISSVPGLYVGAGVNYANTSFDCDICGEFDVDNSASDIGLNLLAGWSFSGSKGPFVQAKFELGGGEQLVISGGLRF
jgi:opacity protein-like surface antigen